MEQVNQSEGFSERPGRRNAVILVAGILALLLVGVGIYSAWVVDRKKSDSIIEPRVKKQTTTTNPLSSTIPSSFEAEDIDDSIREEVASAPLPELDQSDDLIRRSLPAISEQNDLSSWLIPDGLVRKFVLMVDNVSRGDFPRKQLKHYRPKGKFKTKQLGDELYAIDRRSYRRYDLFMGIFRSLDVEAMVNTYLKFKPLFQEAYQDLGYPDGDFDAALLSAMDTILNAPVVEGRIKLYRPSVMFKFTNPRLEKLKPVVKQLIRMGPTHTKTIQAKLHNFGELLRQQTLSKDIESSEKS